MPHRKILHAFLLHSLLNSLVPGVTSDVLPSDLLQMLIADTSTYNSKIRPDADGPPVTVNYSLYVTSLGSIEETTMDYKITLFLRQSWNDPRLAFVHPRLRWLDLSPNIMDCIWKPDMYFSNEKSATLHSVTTDNKMLRVFSNGDTFYSIRLSLTLDCPMNLHAFPADVVKCSMYLESYGWSTRDIVFRWKDSNPVEYSDQITMSEFKLGRETLHDDCTKTYSLGGMETTINCNFTCIRATFSLQRKMGYYLFQIYIPTLLIVIISWVAFWVNTDSPPARVALGMTTILTMTTQNSGLHTSLPKLSYTTAMDVWMTACMVFVFSAFLEYIAVTYALSQGKSILLKLDKCKEEDKEFQEKVLSLAQSIDNFSRVFFPSCFMIFNLFYWVVLLVMLKEE